MSGVGLRAPWFLASSPNPVQGGRTTSSLACRVSGVPRDVLPAVWDEGLVAAPTGDLRLLLIPAQEWLGAVPHLERLVLDVVGHVHPLASEPGYDVSHSQPRWPGRVFLSCPERADGIGALRLAEAVVHEAMHLHLTNEEERSALVATSTGLAHSPWRKASRPVQGVLHGLFVFTCIYRFLERVASTVPLAADLNVYVAERLNTIDTELRQVDVTGLLSGLTSRGKTEVAFWIGGRRMLGCSRTDC